MVFLVSKRLKLLPLIIIFCYECTELGLGNGRIVD
jgi:hypothetical protein